jgi:hypothetical protein
MKLEVRADWSRQVVVLACSLVCPVVLCYAIVAACRSILLGAIAVPAKFTRLSIERISDDDALAFRWVIYSPRTTTGQPLNLTRVSRTY